MNSYWRRKNLANWNPARIPPQTPPAGGKSAEAKRKILSPRKTDFRFAESALKPHALPEYLEGRTPKKNVLSIFKKNFTPAKSKKQETFFFGVAGVLASAWGFLRIICFGNRFELGTINTPRWKSQCLAPPRAGLGDQIVWIFRGKKKFPIPLEAEKKNFNHWIFEIKTAEVLIFLLTLTPSTIYAIFEIEFSVHFQQRSTYEGIRCVARTDEGTRWIHSWFT